MNLEEILYDEDRMGMLYANPEAASNLLGAIQQLPAAQKHAAMVKFLSPKNVGGDALTARDEAMKRIGALPAEIRNGLANKRLQLVDARYYVVKDVANGSTTVRMLASTDDKGPGVGNIAKQQLDKDFFFLCTGIILLSGVAADPMNCAFDTIEKGIANGDFTFRANGKYLMPKDQSCSVFDTSNRTDIENGLFKFANPKWIEPQVDIDFDIRFSQALTNDTNIRLVLVGATVMPY
jgi:hypothetical protein